MADNFEAMNPEDFEATVTLTLDNDEEIECAVVSIFPAGDNNYIALLPLAGKEAEEGEVFLYRYNELENGEVDLQNIESDEEYEIVSDAFDEVLDAAEYEELAGDDE